MADQDDRMPDLPLAKIQEDRIGQRDGAERELLALVDVVLDDDAEGGPIDALAGVDRLDRQLRREQDQPRRQHQQRAGRRGTRRRPTCRAATAQSDRAAPAAPGSFANWLAAWSRARPRRRRPQHADDRQQEQQDRQPADRPLQRRAECATGRSVAHERDQPYHARKSPTADVDHGNDAASRTADQHRHCGCGGRIGTRPTARPPASRRSIAAVRRFSRRHWSRPLACRRSCLALAGALDQRRRAVALAGYRPGPPRRHSPRRPRGRRPARGCSRRP